MGIMFTDRFVKLPIKQYDVEQKELTGTAEYFDNYQMVLPFEISNYKPAEDSENDYIECVAVSLKNGERFLVYLTIEQFEKLLNEHNK